MLAWMLYAVAFATLVAGAALAAERAARLLGLPTRWVWAAALAVSVLARVLLPATAGAPAEMDVVAIPSSGILSLEGVETAPVAGFVAEAGAVPSESVLLDALLPWLSLGGSLGVAALLLASRLRLAAVRRGWRRGRLLRVRVWLSRDSGPAVIGVLRPEIVVPESVLERDRESQRLVLAHEREHIAARDPLLLAFGWLAVLVVPWNPAIWWQLRRLRFGVETDCDARVLAAGRDVLRYGSLLLEVGRSASIGMPVAAFAEPKSMLQRRIETMTSQRPKHPFRLTATFVALCGLAVAAAAAVPAPEMPLELLWASSSAPLEIAAPDTTTPPVDIREVPAKPELINASEIQRSIARSYPPLLRDAGVGGNAVVRLVVSEAGTVRPGSITVEHATHPAFGEAAAQATRSARFTPGRMDGRPVPVTLSLPVQFRTQPADTTPRTALDSLRRENARLRREVERLRGEDGTPGAKGTGTPIFERRLPGKAIARDNEEMRRASALMQRRAGEMRERSEEMQRTRENMLRRGEEMRQRSKEMRAEVERMRTVIQQELERHYPEIARHGLAAHKYFWVAIDDTGEVRQRGILELDLDQDGSWSTRSVERQIRAALPGTRIAKVHLARGAANIAWVTIETVRSSR